MKKMLLTVIAVSLTGATLFAETGTNKEMNAEKLTVVKVSLPEPSPMEVGGGVDPTILYNRMFQLQDLIRAKTSELNKATSAKTKADIQKELDVLNAQLKDVKDAIDKLEKPVVNNKPVEKPSTPKRPYCQVVKRPIAGGTYYDLQLDYQTYIQGNMRANSAKYMMEKCMEAQQQGLCWCKKDIY